MLVNLADCAMVLFDADLEAANGVPQPARASAHLFASTEVLVVVSPESKGSVPPLLKNTIDWLTRVDLGVMAYLTALLASASPGSGGGARGLAMVRTWMRNIGVAVAENILTIGSVNAAVGERGEFDAAARGAFVSQASVAA